MSLTQDEATALAEKIDAVISNPQAASGLDTALRRRLREAGRKLNYAMEGPLDTAHRISNTSLQLYVARVGVEKGIFNILAETQGTITNAALAEKAGIDPFLLKRLLRYYQSFDMIAQPEDDGYSANHTTAALANPGVQAGINYFAETIGPSIYALPQFLRETGYVNPTDPSHVPWHIGHRTDLNPFPWLQQNPKHMEYFLPWMISNRSDLPIFLDALDFKQLAIGATDSTVLFVDVGGAMGHQCVVLKQKFPELPGRVILQDQPFIIEQAKAAPLPGFGGIEAEVYDFFTPQPVKGARAYYLRNVLHDWPDHKCVEILTNVKAGLTEESVILIDEIVFPLKGSPWRATQLDIAMLTCLAAWERTAAEWEALIDKAGLKIKEVLKYTDESEDCIIVAVPK